MTARERLVSLQRLVLTVVVLRALLVGVSVAALLAGLVFISREELAAEPAPA